MALTKKIGADHDFRGITAVLVQLQLLTRILKIAKRQQQEQDQGRSTLPRFLLGPSNPLT
jgi:hypothetical protein